MNVLSNCTYLQTKKSGFMHTKYYAPNILYFFVVIHRSQELVELYLHSSIRLHFVLL
jgi:hypothetical protein